MRKLFKLGKYLPEYFRPGAKVLESAIYFTLAMGLSFTNWRRYFLLSGSDRYKFMLKIIYNYNASISNYPNGDGGNEEYVVGNYSAHNQWPDIENYLFKYVDAGFLNKNGLDFGCGPGRNIINYHARFGSLDGVDVAEFNLKNAARVLDLKGVKNSNLYLSAGDDLGSVKDSHYHFIFSTIVFQHICVHSIRISILSRMFQALVPGGRISIQMLFGKLSTGMLGAVDYKANFYAALASNSQHDCIVQDILDVKGDLEALGFEEFEHWIRPGGPGFRVGESWLFFTALKPA